jgi:hypothetical protein
MKNNPASIGTVILIVSLFYGCSSLNTKADYRDTRTFLENASISDAVHALPLKEGRSFITIMEKTYLNLLQGKPEIDELYTYSHRIDNQVRYRVSTELENLFYVETPEGYYASEHEIIWMHFLLSSGFSMRGKVDEARVEAKMAANFLSMEWSPKGRFDDPFMRIFLSCLWMMTDDWEEARVDLRAAAKLDGRLQWALQLAQLEKKPEQVVMVLGGCGPEPERKPTIDANVLRGNRNIVFIPSGLKTVLTVGEGRTKNETHITPDSAAWYERHFKRNNAINDLVNDSKYGQRVAGTAAKAVGIAAFGYTAAAVVFSGGWVIGGGLIYVGIVYAANDALEMAGAGLTIGVLATVKSVDIVGKTNNTIDSEVTEDLDVSTAYRYVRFLPEYAWCFWKQNPKSVTEEKYFFINRPQNAPFEITPVHSMTVNGVTVNFIPDSPLTPRSYENP